MMSQTHLLISAATFCHPDQRARNTAVIIGAIVPDLAITVFYIWSKFAQIPEGRIWTEYYFEEPMTTLQSVFNSVPLFALILLIAFLIWRKKSILAIFALSALLHLACDFPVHTHDAHAHFWPATDWRFHSLISYWDTASYGGYFMIFETLLGIVLGTILFRRFRSLWVRAVLILLIIAYVAVPAWFMFNLGS
ncbi:MAG: hypothetical protein ACI8UO_000528 [Verrucomicrobiales bacterium]|jgi:hypothetical protein